jgi:hypothetical protein
MQNNQPGERNQRRARAFLTASFTGGTWRMDQAQKLRDLASWYREFAERAENPAIWDARLRTAEDLEREALNIESRSEHRLERAS